MLNRAHAKQFTPFSCEIRCWRTHKRPIFNTNQRLLTATSTFHITATVFIPTDTFSVCTSPHISAISLQWQTKAGEGFHCFQVRLYIQCNDYLFTKLKQRKISHPNGPCSLLIEGEGKRILPVRASVNAKLNIRKSWDVFKIFRFLINAKQSNKLLVNERKAMTPYIALMTIPLSAIVSCLFWTKHSFSL